MAFLFIIMKDFLGLVPALLILSILLLFDAYIFQLLRTALQGASPLIRKISYILFFTIVVLFYITFAYAFFTDYHTWPNGLRRLLMGFVFSWLAAKFFMLPFLLIDDLLRLGRWIIALFYSGSGNSGSEMTGHEISRLQFLSKAGIIVGGSIFGAFMWGVFRTAYNYKIRNIDLKINQLPKEMSGIKIAQISDMHLGSFSSADPLNKFVSIINDLEVDLVFFTGDLVNDLSVEILPEYVSALSKLKAKYGVYSCLGNHDYGNYTNWPTKAAKIANHQEIRDFHKQFGWKLLANANQLIPFGNSQLAVIGVENWGHSDHFPKYGDIDKAVIGTENATVKLLLSHDPSHWDYIISQTRNDIDCTFSGHTHGFQFGVEIPALKIKWSPSQYAYKQWAGLYKKGAQQLYVNRGIGFIGYPGRVGIPPEISVFTLQES